MTEYDLKDPALSEYRRVINVCIKSGKEKTAFALLQHALSDYPEDPFILSFYGLLEARFDRNYQSSVEKCKKAIFLLESMTGKRNFLPVLYLNLGKAYMAAGQRKDALIAFYGGLKYGRSTEIIRELEMAGMRKTPPLPFLGRSNVLNKYVGLMLHKFKNSQQKNFTVPAFMLSKEISPVSEKFRQ